MRKILVPIVASLALALGLLLGSFASTGAALAQAESAKPGIESHVRVAHLSPDAPNVDVYVNGRKTLSNVAFKTVSDYLAVPAGTYRFQVRPAGAASNSQPVIDATAKLAPRQYYTVAAIDFVAHIRGLVLQDDVAAPAQGQAKVRVVHASPDAPAVDVVVVGGPKLVSNLSFGQASSTLSVAAGTYNLAVNPAGGSSAVLSLPNTRLEAGKVYTVFVADRLAKLTVVVTAINGVGNPAGSDLNFNFRGTVLSGPSAGTTLSGPLSLTLDGAKVIGTLKVGNQTIPVTGRLANNNISVTFDLGDGQFIFGVGSKLGNKFEGFFVGPKAGDFGFWSATSA